MTDANNNTTTYLYDSQDRLTTVQFPDGTTNLYSYNSQGNVTKFVDGRSNATTYQLRRNESRNRFDRRTERRHHADLRLRRQSDRGPGADAGRPDGSDHDICL